MSERKPVVLLLHGFLSGSPAWNAFRREVDGDVTTVAPDLLGYGRANRPRAAYTLDAVLDDIEPAVDDANPDYVVGHSMGGIVTLALAARYPGRFRRLGLVGLPVYSSREDGRRFLVGNRGFGHRILLAHDGTMHVGCDGMFRSRRLWRPTIPFVTPRHPEEHAICAFDHSRESHVGGLDGIVFAGLVPGLAASVSDPVVALHGGKDTAAPPARVRTIAERRGWDFAVAPTGDHQLHLVRPAQTARWFRERLLGQPRAAAAK